jgi:hypothetical protein
MIARAVVSPYWENGRRASLSGRLAGTTLVELQFLLDGRPLSGTPSWAEAPSLIAPAIAACLRNLRRKSEAIVLSVRGFPSHRRRVNGRTIELPSEAEIYLDYVLARRIENYQWITRSDQDSIRSELICEVPDQWLAGVIRDHWEWHSISGYLLQRRDVPRALDGPFSSGVPIGSVGVQRSSRSPRYSLKTGQMERRCGFGARSSTSQLSGHE